jgi:hypothetical protein
LSYNYFVDKESGLCGMLPMFETREQATKACPENKVIEVTEDKP